MNPISVAEESVAEVPKGNTSFRRATVTIYNHNFNEFKALANDDRVTYGIGQEEVCPTTGRDHIQGYVEFDKARRINAIKKILPSGANIRCSNGTAAQNRVYCSKEQSRKPGSEVFEWGKPREQGRRSDIISLKRALEEGKSEAELCSNGETFGAWLRYPGVLKRFKTAKIVPRDRSQVPDVSVYTGASGVGKTRRVFDEHKDDVYMKDNSKWWDGYVGQRCILLDELETKEHWKIEEMLRLLDRYPYQGQTKGGYININSPFIAITSNKSLDELYPEISHEQMSALERRITNKISL